MRMDNFHYMSFMQLIWSKTRGCYSEFGVKEVLRRFIHESFRAMTKSKGFLDISFVTEHIGIGAAPRSSDAVKYLEKLGFKHLIDLRAERRKSDILAKTNLISIHWVPTYDDWRPKPAQFFEKLEEAIKQILASQKEVKFLACCVAGEHRAPLAGVLALSLMGYSLDNAAKMVKKARPVAELLPSYESSLVEYINRR